MKIRDILKVRESVKHLAQVRLPNAIDNYHVFKLYKQVEDEAHNYNVQKDKVVIEYGERQPNGSVSISAENPKYMTAIKLISELENIDIELQLNKTTIKPAELNLSAKDIYNLVEFGILEIAD